MTSQRLGRYLLVNKIATGGMAEIFLAKLIGAEGFEKEIAIKKILPQWASDRGFIAMLIDEAKISVQLSHPNIIQVYELAREGEDYYLAMEYVSGVDLRRLMRKAAAAGKRIPLDVSLAVITDVLEALSYAHAKRDNEGKPWGIVHRDISPQNILVSYDGAVKIADFGIAKAASRTQETIGGVLKGKFAYMSPEQANGEDLDQRSDLFSAAVVFYELLTGERLFSHGSDIDTLDRVRRGQVSFSALAEKAIPPRLKEVLNRALTRGREERFPDAGTFREEVIRFARRSRRLVRREKVATFLSMLFAKEILVQKEEATQVLSQATALLEEETRSVAGKEVFVQRPLPEAPAAPSQGGPASPVREGKRLSLRQYLVHLRRPEVVAGGLLISVTLLFVFWVFWFLLPRRPEPVSSLPALSEPPPARETPPPAVPPEVAPPISKKQALPALVDLPPHPNEEEEMKKGVAPPPAKVGSKQETDAFLSVQAVPWGHVTVDGGSQRWETPLRRLPLKKGRHRVAVHSGEAVVVATVTLETARETVCVADLHQKRIQCED